MMWYNSFIIDSSVSLYLLNLGAYRSSSVIPSLVALDSRAVPASICSTSRNCRGSLRLSEHHLVLLVSAGSSIGCSRWCTWCAIRSTESSSSTGKEVRGSTCGGDSAHGLCGVDDTGADVVVVEAALSAGVGGRLLRLRVVGWSLRHKFGVFWVVEVGVGGLLGGEAAGLGDARGHLLVGEGLSVVGIIELVKVAWANRLLDSGTTEIVIHFVVGISCHIVCYILCSVNIVTVNTEGIGLAGIITFWLELVNLRGLLRYFVIRHSVINWVKRPEISFV